MAPMLPGLLRREKGNGDYKGRIALALRDIETQRRELEALKGRLAERRQRLFETTVKALETKNRSKAVVYANEHAELIKVSKVVEASELALTQVSLRLQSITEIGDAMFHMDAAFKSLKQISKTVQGVVPALDAASTDINSTLVETMAQMGQISPTLSIDVRTENGDELVEQARRYAEEQSQHLRDSLNMDSSSFDEQIMSSADDGASLLATGDGEETRGHGRKGEQEDDGLVLGTLYTTRQGQVESAVLTYAVTHDGPLDVSKTSEQLGIPQELVEQSMIRLVAQGKVKPAEGGGHRTPGGGVRGE